MGAVLISTMVTFLLERLLRSLDLLSQTERGFDYLLQLAVNLTPHYAGLVLPSGFFVGLFVAMNRLNNSSEIDALLAGGISLRRITMPFVWLGVAFMLLSIGLYGYAQPYTRYGYRAVLHAAENAGWSGEVKPQAILSPSSSLVLTADGSDSTGHILDHVFIRRVADNGREDVFTARYAKISRDAAQSSVTLELVDGQQVLREAMSGATRLLTFDLLTIRLPTVAPARLLRARGGKDNELTLNELATQGFDPAEPAMHREALLGELYSRLARALSLPFMPLLAMPFALTAKRAGTAPAIAVAGVMLFAFQTWIIFAQGLVTAGRLAAAPALGIPMALFLAACVTTFHLSRKRPGENPVTWLSERAGDLITLVIRRILGRAKTSHLENRFG